MAKKNTKKEDKTPKKPNENANSSDKKAGDKPPTSVARIVAQW
jgi:hypothetical protein